jgi:oligopeptidase B
MGAPLAEREPVEHVIHGDRRMDHYAWMREKKDPRVRAYLEAENAYADLEMRGTEELQEQLYQEMLGRIQQTDLSVPYLLRGYEYYTRTEEGKQYPIYCRKRVQRADSRHPLANSREGVARGEGRGASAQRAKEEHEGSLASQTAPATAGRLGMAGLSEKEMMEQLRAELRTGFGVQKTEDAGSGSEQKSGSLALLGMTGNAEHGSKEKELGTENVADVSDLESNPSKLSVSNAGAARKEVQEEVLLDLNEMAAGHTFMALGIFEVSDDNRWLAYATDTTGYRQYVLEVKELDFNTEDAETRAQRAGREEGLREDFESTGGRQNFRVERVTSAAWAMDNRTLFYVTEDEVTKRSNQLWRHVFAEVESDEWWVAREERRSQQPTADSQQTKEEGSGASAGAGAELPGLGGVETERPGAGLPHSRVDELIYEERDERFRMDVERSRSGAYLFLEINSHTTSEMRYLRADAPFGAFQAMADREDEHEYYVDHHPGSARDEAGGVFFIRTNSGGRTYRLVTAPTSDPGQARWHEVIANRPDVMLSGVAAFRTHLVVTEREDGLPHLRIIDLTRKAGSALEASLRLSFSEPTYSAMLGTNPEFDTGFVRFQYESMVTPKSVFDYEVKSGKWTLKKRQPVLGNFDPGNYVSERLHAKGTDGTAVPISLVRRKDTMRDGSAPLLLYGYGSYGISMPVTFNSNRLSLLDRGLMFAIAHIRGGGELGKPWHDAGRMHKKMNTFTDFIACADFLEAKRYTSADRLVIEGGSAGGLLLGTVVNLRPEKFRAVVSHVPFVDVLNTMLDASLPLTVGEYEEWGNPEKADDYFYMKQYCPYTNVERKAYPRMLVKTAWNDSQVMVWEAAKYAAKLRAMKTDGNVLLLKTNMGAGHGGASGRYDYLREIAMDYAFVLREVGVRREVEEV